MYNFLFSLIILVNCDWARLGGRVLRFFPILGSLMWWARQFLELEPCQRLPHLPVSWYLLTAHRIGWNTCLQPLRVAWASSQHGGWAPRAREPSESCITSYDGFRISHQSLPYIIDWYRPENPPNFNKRKHTFYLLIGSSKVMSVFGKWKLKMCSRGLCQVLGISSFKITGMIPFHVQTLTSISNQPTEGLVPEPSECAPCPLQVGCGLLEKVSHLGSSLRSCLWMCAIMSVKHFEFLIINFLSFI